MKSRFSRLPKFLQWFILWVPRIQLGFKSKDVSSKKICIYKADRIGDFVLAMGAIRFLTNKFGEKELVLVVSSISSALAKKEFPEATVLVVKPFGGSFCWMAYYEWFHFRKTISQYHFEHLLCLRHYRLDYDEILLSWIYCDRSVGIAKSDENHNWSYLFTNSFSYPDARQGLLSKELLASKSLLQCFSDCADREVLPEFKTFSQSNGGYMLCSPFASHTEKDFPEVLLTEFFDKLGSSISKNLVLTATQNDSSRLEAISQALQNSVEDKALNIISTYPSGLDAYIQLIADANVVLTVDTATAHIAAAMDKPVVVIIGGGHFDSFGPWYRSNKQEWVFKKLPCYNCGWFCTEASILCINEITADDILESLNKVKIAMF